MLCLECSHRAVCKNLEMLISSGIEISKCHHYLQGQSQQVIVEKVEKVKENKPASLYKPNLNKKKQELKKLATCPSCKGIDYEEEMSICSECNETICGNCSVCIDGELLCDKCYKNNDMEVSKDGK